MTQTTDHSRLQKRFASGLAALEILIRKHEQQFMREATSRTYLVTLSDLLQWVDLVNLDLELTRLKQAEELVGVVFKLLARLNVAEQGGTGDFNTLRR